MKSMRSLYKKLFHYVPDKRILAYFSMALSAAAVCSYMGAYWFLWQSIVSILVIPVYEKAMYDAIIVVILMILRGILNIASATCSHYLGFRLETNLRKNGLHKLLDASSSFFDHNSSGEIRKIIDDNAAETHKTVAHLIPDNVTAVMTPVLMFVLMFAIDYRLGILLILTTVIGVLQYPGLCIFVTAAGFNLFGEALRDIQILAFNISPQFIHSKALSVFVAQGQIVIPVFVFWDQALHGIAHFQLLSHPAAGLMASFIIIETK